MGLFNWKKKRKPDAASPKKDISNEISDLMNRDLYMDDMSASAFSEEDKMRLEEFLDSASDLSSDDSELERGLMALAQNNVDVSAPALSSENKIRLEKFVVSTTDLFRDDSKDARDAGNSFLRMLADLGRHASPYLSDRAFAEEFFEYAMRWRAFFQSKENRELFRDGDVVNLAINHLLLKDKTWSLQHEMIQIREEVCLMKSKLQEERGSSNPYIQQTMERVRDKKIRYEQCEKECARAANALKTTELALKAKGVSLGLEMDQPVSENEEKTEADISAAPDVSDIPFNF